MRIKSALLIGLLQSSKRRVILSSEGGERHEEQKKPGCGCSQKGCRTCTAQGRKPDNLLEYLPTKSTRCTKALQEQQVMATKFAERIVRKLIAVSAVEEVDRELYVYGFFLLISHIFFFLITVAFGCFLRISCESVIFYIVFMLLRSYAGGVHARTEMACTVWTMVAMGMATVFIKVLEASTVKIPLCVLFFNICLLVLSPLDSGEKPLDAEEKHRYRKICLILVFICDVVAAAASMLATPMLYYPVVCGMGVEVVLLVIGKIFYN